MFTYDPTSGEWITVDAKKVQDQSQLMAGSQGPLQHFHDEIHEESKNNSDKDLEEWAQNQDYQTLITSKLDELYDRKGFSQHQKIFHEDNFLRNSIKNTCERSGYLYKKSPRFLVGWQVFFIDN